MEALQWRQRSPSPINPAANTNQLPFRAFVADGAHALLASLATPAGYQEGTPAADWPEPSSTRQPPDRILDWGLSDHTELEPSPEARAVGQIAQQLLQFQDMDAASDDEMQERSDEEDDNDNLQEPTVTVDNGDNYDDHREKCARNRDHTQYSRQWHPWTDRIVDMYTGYLDASPSVCFSHWQLELFLWFLKVNNVDDVPSVKSMQELNAMLQKLCGIETIGYDGALGHKYYVNSLGQIISQEMSNPKVRPHLEFYPEDTGKLLEQARQGKCWLEEMPSFQTTPMTRIGDQDYFIYEPAMLDDGKFCVPHHWFCESEVSQAGLKSFPKLKADISLYNFPDPSKINDVQDPLSGALSPWDLTDPAFGNPWRECAKGARVLAFPIWLYCDDTSGNLSKKWNEHNSFLFTPAGLPRKEAKREYNVHFLCTSNIAPPLEMLDEVLDQLEPQIRTERWDLGMEQLNELVLIIPSVLALLGDNPMQSEFACHIGLHGKYFCRACWVKGGDSLDDQDATLAHPKDPKTANTSDSESQAGTDTESDAGSDGDSAPPHESSPQADLPLGATNEEMGAGSSPEPDPSPFEAPEITAKHTSTTTTNTVPVDPPQMAAPDSAEQPKKSCGKRAKETLEQTMSRVKSFVKIGKLRTKEETTDKLWSYFDEASTLNTKTKVKNMRTASGIKDTFQMVFLEKLFNSYKNKRGNAAWQAALDADKPVIGPCLDTHNFVCYMVEPITVQ
ncbi:hypothetical protein DFH08DRAFT_967771 [Mycena albidolilacea]|uniref:Transposase n=1 Tax=Mycena albidolilacea TaxID=1033008 RepID=A0AAD6ZL43_9AGAR|nr:hypothetical protein DFH08DRAFT_967771 [Mycena albidolilacea]